MPVAYRSTFAVDGEVTGRSALDLAVREFLQWCIKDKAHHINELTSGVTQLECGTSISFIDTQTLDGARRVFASLTEATGWVTSMTLYDPQTKSAQTDVLIEVEAPIHPESAYGYQIPGVPRLVRRLLGQMLAKDGAAVLAPECTVVREEEVSDVLAAIDDDFRRYPLYLAPCPPEVPFHQWLTLIKEVTKSIVGVASVYVLDSEAHEVASDLLGEFAQPSGTLRTFLPAVDLSAPSQASRQRIMSSEYLGGNRRSFVAKVLAANATSRSVSVTLPQSIRRSQKILANALIEERIMQARVAALVTESDPVAIPASDVELDQVVFEAEVITVLSAIVQQVKPGAEVSPESLHLALTALQEAEQLKNELVVIRQDREKGLEEHISLQEEYTSLERENLDLVVELTELANVSRTNARRIPYLERLLRDQGAREDLFAVPDLEIESFDALHKALSRGELKRIKFTGDYDHMVDLDAHDPDPGSWASNTWDALMALNDYAEAKAEGEISGSFDAYLSRTPSGRHTLPANKHAHTESSFLKNDPFCAQARIFPVPAHVDPQGKKAMWAHIRIATYRRISPRMHYHDHTAVDGLIYVGYIGQHLPIPSQKAS